MKFLKPEQIKEIWPLCNTEGLIGAIQHPEDGYIQPADLTQALATGARNKGAEIYRNTTVVGIKQTKNGWVVEKYYEEGLLKNCWLTTLVSSPVSLGSSV